MKRVVCDVTSPPALQLFSRVELHGADREKQLAPKHLLFDDERSYEKDIEVEGQALQYNNGTSFTPPFPSNIRTHTTASMMKYYLDVNFYSTFPRAQNHADNSLLPSF